MCDDTEIASAFLTVVESELHACYLGELLVMCRGFTNPLRKLWRQLAPRSALAREFAARLANLHSTWHQIMTDVLVGLPS